MRKTTKLEAVLWSVALPGFGQLLNGQLIKGLTLYSWSFLLIQKVLLIMRFFIVFLDKLTRPLK